MAGMRVKFETRKFNRTFMKYLEVSKKGIVQALNEKALDLAYKAAKYTKRGERGEIRALGKAAKKPARAKRRAGKGISPEAKKAQAKDRRAKLKFNRLAAVYVGLQKKKGMSFTNKDVKEKAPNLIRDRLRAVGYLASGWIPAIRKFQRAAKKNFGRIQGVTKRPGTKGGEGYPASLSQRKPTAIIRNSLHALEDDKAYRFSERAFVWALSKVQQDMEIYLRRKMIEAGKKLGMKVR